MHTKWALVPLAVVMVLDFGFTLVGQPDCYWDGSYEECVEMSPVGRVLLRSGPVWFGIAYFFYAIAVCFFVGKLKKPLDIAFIMGLLLGHAWGSSSWLPKMFYSLFGVWLNDDGIWWLHIVYIACIACICGVFFRSEIKKTDAIKPSQ